MHRGHYLARGVTGQRCEFAIRVHAIVNLQRPRHRGFAPIEFLIEPVAQATDTLCEDDTGSRGVGKRGELQPFNTHHDGDGRHPKRHRPHNA